MIDLIALRKQPELFKTLLVKKEPQYPVEELIEYDQKVREARHQLETLQHQKNILVSHDNQKPSDITQEESKTLSGLIKEKKSLLTAYEAKFNKLYLECPNILASDVPAGDKMNNQVIRTGGTMKEFSFLPEHHVKLNERLQWFNFSLGAKLAGPNFVFYNKQGAQLLYALVHFMLDHNKNHGFQICMPPAICNERALEGAGQFPRFKDAVYELDDSKLFLIPTSEVSLTGMYQDYLFSENELPIRMTSWTSCFRKEAGGYGTTERGLIRIHQFEKIELYTITRPEDSQQEHEKMITCAEEILKKLGLHYRISLLAGQDCSFSSAKTYDLEVWMPGQRAFYEVSSASNCTDFQARRSNIRFKRISENKNLFVHTLNASSLALPRLMVALMEQYQQEDGSIFIPEILRTVHINL